MRGPVEEQRGSPSELRFRRRTPDGGRRATDDAEVKATGGGDDRRAMAMEKREEVTQGKSDGRRRATIETMDDGRPTMTTAATAKGAAGRATTAKDDSEG